MLLVPGKRVEGLPRSRPRVSGHREVRFEPFRDVFEVGSWLWKRSEAA